MRWFHIGMKDLTITVRDRAALGVLLAMPMLLIVILGSALGNLAANIEKIPVAIVDLDQGRMGHDVTKGFFEDEELAKLFLATTMRSETDARAAVERGDLAGALIVPEDFTRRINTGKPATLVVFTDPGRQITGSVFRSVAEAVSTHVSAASIAARTSAFYASKLAVQDPGFLGSVIGKAVRSSTESSALDAVGLEETTAVRGKDISMLSYYAGAMSVMFITFGAMFGAFSLIRERDEWTLPRILMTHATRTDIVGGKAFGVLLIGLLQFSVLYLFTSALGVNWGDPLAVFLVAVPTVTAATGMALFIASVAKTVRSVSGIAQVFIQAMAALGGSFFPVAQFPAWLQPLHYFTVNGWAIDGMLSTMRGGTAVDILPNAGALLLMGAAFLAVGAWRLRWE